MLNIAYAVLTCLFLLVLTWSLYNVPILAVGVRHLRRSSRKNEKALLSGMGELPMVSIVIPVRNEEKVVKRLLEVLLRFDYPPEKWEVLIVDGGSTDKTVEICRDYVARYPGLIRLLHQPSPSGKPSAINYALKHARGEIVGVFDADSVPEPDVLKRVVRYFREPSVGAVQGRTLSINSEENMLTKFISIEEAVWCEAYLRGKDVLDLFVHLRGSCQFIRRDVLERMGGFDGEALSEDMELSARLVEGGYGVRYASDVRSWQETPSDLKALFKQRIRWFRGTMEVALKYGRLVAKLSRRSFDAELTLAGPFILIASLISYFLAFHASFAAFNFDVLLRFLMQLSAIGTSVTLMVCGLALAYVSKPRKPTNLLWLPFIYFYWSLQAFIALYAAILILLRRPRKWIKTEKTGAIKKRALLIKVSN